MAQVPGIVHSVRVEDLDQGAIPLRLKTFKILPPSETDFLANSEAEKQKGGKQETPAAAATALTMEESQENDVADEDEEEGPGVDTGDYVNLEVTFSYRRNPKRARKQKISHAKANRSDAPKETEKGTLEIGETMVESTSNPAMDAAALTADLPVEQIHMLLYLSVGLQKIAGIDLPVWIEVVGIEGKMRLRMQLVPAAPFVKVNKLL